MFYTAVACMPSSLYISQSETMCLAAHEVSGEHIYHRRLTASCFSHADCRRKILFINLERSLFVETSSAAKTIISIFIFQSLSYLPAAKSAK